MTAYIVFTRESTTDQLEMDIYSSQVGPTFAGHPVTVLAAYGALDVLEGDPIEGAVIVSFPSIAEAKAWYKSPAYQEVAVHRFAGARYRAFIVDGIA